jgi:hypothetical protein
MGLCWISKFLGWMRVVDRFEKYHKGQKLAMKKNEIKRLISETHVRLCD